MVFSNFQNQNSLPDFLTDYGTLVDYINSQVSRLKTTKEKGSYFEKFACEIAARHPDIALSTSLANMSMTKGSWDEGVDIEIKNDDESDILYIQTKLQILGVDDLDLVISKFDNYYKTKHIVKESKVQQLSLLNYLDNQPKPNDNSKRVQFMIITLSDIRRILQKYETSGRSSLSFYNSLKNNNYIHIIDGRDIL